MRLCNNCCMCCAVYELLTVGEESSGNLISHVKEAHVSILCFFFFFFSLINAVKIFGKHPVKAKNDRQEKFPSVLLSGFVSYSATKPCVCSLHTNIYFGLQYLQKRKRGYERYSKDQYAKSTLICMCSPEAYPLSCQIQWQNS